MGMTFTCTHCGEPIHGVAAIHNGEIMHHRCAEAHAAKLASEAEGLEETPMEVG
jgi:hypothetical protein